MPGVLVASLVSAALGGEPPEAPTHAKTEETQGAAAPVPAPVLSNARPALLELTNSFLLDPAGVKPADGSPRAPGEGEVNPALLEDSGSLASSNMVSRGEASPETIRLEESGRLLEHARQQRQEGHGTQARNNFVTLIESAAPDEIKRVAMIELALIAQEANQLSRAQQIFSHFLKSYPQDPSVPEVTLRQGLLYRQMGAPALALSKFYAVMTAALTLKNGSVPNSG